MVHASLLDLGGNEIAVLKLLGGDPNPATGKTWIMDVPGVDDQDAQDAAEQLDAKGLVVARSFDGNPRRVLVERITSAGREALKQIG